MAFLDAAIRRCEELWKRELEHPFVRGIADGSLPESAFRFYLEQDYVFLIEYARVLAWGAAKADDLDTMERFADLLRATLRDEMALHRRTCAGYGVDAATLACTEPAPACAAYTGHLIATARDGSFAELCAALLPCAVGYARIGRALAESGAAPAVRAYRDWIATYAGEEFQTYAEWLAGVTDRVARPDARTLELFEASVRHEIDFWEMAWNAR
jgi:thiaminase/transcriptional activator TenA